MADTCYLCAVGSSRIQVTPRATTTDGLGTCTKCSVHACPKHGDRDPKHFRCADCITSSAAQNIVSPDPQVQGTIHRHGSVALFAQAPALALISAPLLAEDRTPQMHAALNDLGEYPSGAMDHARQWLNDRLTSFDTVELATALGLDAHDVHDQLFGRDIRETLLQIAQAKLELTFTQLHDELGGAEGLRFDSAQASYALAVLAVALSARDGLSLDVPITDVRGGLYMPAIVVLLSTIFLMEVRR